MSATKTKGKALIAGALLSSNSGFQRLSQAALSRSRFLRRAAGALLPFVGLRLSAADTTRPTTGKSPSGPGSERMTSLPEARDASKRERFRIAVLDDYQREEQNASLARAVIGGLLFATPTTCSSCRICSRCCAKATTASRRKACLRRIRNERDRALAGGRCSAA